MDDPTDLTADKLLVVKAWFSEAVQHQRTTDAALGLCVCANCFGDRLKLLMLGQRLRPRRPCLESSE